MAVYSQEKSIALTGTNSFTSNESYLISNPYGVIYDNSGWLWILGENKLSNKYIFGEKEIIIQRFDGSNFFTLKIPETPSKKIKEGHFFKHKEKGLYMKLYYRVARAELFFINTETLEIQAVDAYNNLDEKYIISKEYQVADHSRLMITSKDKFYSAELDKSSLKMIDSVAFDQSVANPFIAEIKTTVDYSIVKLLFEKDGCLVGKDGKIIKKINKSDFVNLEGAHFFPEVIHNVIKIKGEYYHYIDDYPNAFSYDQQIKKFIEIPNTSDNYKINRLLEFKNKDNIAVEGDLVSDYSEIKLYKFNDFKTELISQVEVKNFSKIVYKRFGEDLVVLNGNTLRCYTFKENKIKTFLKDKSIRTIKKMGENTYMVATDMEGFYIIDVKNNTERKVTFMDNDVPLSINYSRDILNGKNNTIITGGSNFLYTIDANYNVIREETIKTRGEEIIRVKDSIFTSDQRGGISKYSLNEKKYLEIENTDEI